ncbi:uncharacterized protein LOC113362008 isoform X1 [Papaver somniferum]|uniref:uncharacterized protein LOC113362008 isoform X1 n=1 Tax=Papaver somniferum TaxID=3469 RepID=UPI000E6F6A9E|nr:uncharacterized protein LOC113362008 isoform X1 [Papaver somniferum]
MADDEREVEQADFSSYSPYILRPKKTIKSLARFAFTSMDADRVDRAVEVDVCVDTEEKQNEKDTGDDRTMTHDDISASPSVNPAEVELGISIHEHPTDGLPFDLLLKN